jgi:hypothetical protein
MYWHFRLICIPTGTVGTREKAIQKTADAWQAPEPNGTIVASRRKEENENRYF